MVFSKSFASAALAAMLFGTLPFVADTAKAQSASPFDGAYVGVGAGYSFARQCWYSYERDKDEGCLKPGSSSLVANAGYNVVMGNFLLGAEAAYDSATLDKNGGNAEEPLVDLRTELGSTMSVAGKFGFVENDFAIYGKVGYAWQKADYLYFDTGVKTAAADKRLGGLLLGAGIEYMITSQISLAADYTFINYGDNDLTFDIVDPGSDWTSFVQKIDQQSHLVAIKINLHF